MKRIATPGNRTGSSSSSRRYRYTKVLDNRKHAIRGLWRRNGKFVARITVEDDAGRKAVKWVPLEATSAAEAKQELDKLVVERSENRLRHIGRGPKLRDYLEQTYLPRLDTSGKKPATLVTEKGHLNRWRDSIGNLYLDKIRPYHVTGHLQKLKQRGKANRTCNLALVVLRNVLKSARVDGFIKALPVDGIPWQRTEKKARRLYTREDVDLFCHAALTASKNGVEFTDYVRLLALCGAREQETIKLRWADVDFEHKLLANPAELEILGDGRQRKDYLHVDDCIEGIMTGYEKSSSAVNVFNLGLEEQTSVDELADVVVEEMGLVGVRKRYTGGARGWVGDNPVVYLSIRKIQALGWEPRMKAKDAIRLTARWTLGELRGQRTTG